MSFTCLCDFLEDLQRCEDLLRIEAEIDPCFEAAEVARQACARGAKAVLMARLAGHDLPLLINLLANERRICQALGVGSLQDIAKRLEALLDPVEPEGWFERLKSAPARSILGKLPPRVVKTGAVQQVVRLGGDVDLNRLPFPHSWPDEPGRSVTAAMLCWREAESARRLVAMKRLEIIDRSRMAVCWQSHEEGRRIFDDYRRRGRAMPVAVVLGGDPVCLLAAMSPLPARADVWSFAGLLREKSLDLVTCRSIDLEVPADAEIVIEGSIDPEAETVQSGPWCMPSGYYAQRSPAQVVNVTAISQRSNPVCPAMVLGPIPDRPRRGITAAIASNEWVTIARAMAKAALPLVRAAIPELVDFDLPACGWGRSMAFVSIRKTYAGQARRVANAIWGLPCFMFCKLLVLVDEDVDVHDGAAVWSRVSAMVDPGRDVFFGEGPPNPADPAFCGVVASDGDYPGRADRESAGRMAIDATRRLAGGSTHQAEAAKMDRKTQQMVEQRWREYGLGEWDGAIT